VLSVHQGAAEQRDRPERAKRILQDAASSNIREIKGFVTGLKRDQAAVEAALQYAWSNGQTEGQVNRLKNLKRQMYGSAKFDLLKARLLAIP